MILSELQILEACNNSGYELADTPETKFRISSAAIAKAQDAETHRADVEWLEAPCDEHHNHWIIGKDGSKTEVFWKHRKDCPQCWAKFKGE